MASRIVIYGEEERPSARLSNQLAASGFAVELIVDRSVAERTLQQDLRPLVIVPASTLNAEEQCAVFRASGVRIIAVLPEASDEHPNRDRTVAAWLQAGADAVISASLGRRELAARLRAALRTHPADEMPTAAPLPNRIGQLEIDDAGHLVPPTGEAVSLTPTEFRLLAALARRQRQPRTTAVEDHEQHRPIDGRIEHRGERNGRRRRHVPRSARRG